MLRGPEDVGCAHCTKNGADHECLICGRLVCAACADDWTTCDQPAGRVVRFGLGARVRAVDPSGTFALVMQWPRAPRIVDLRTFAVAHKGLPYGMHTGRLTRDARLVYFDEPVDPDKFGGVMERTLATGQERTLLFDRQRRPYRGVHVTATDDLYYFISESQEVVMIAADGTVTAVEPLPRKALHSVFLDAARGLLATASWAELSLDRIGEGRISYTRTRVEGDVVWIAFGGPCLVAAVRRGAGAHLEIRALDDRGLGKLVRELDFEVFHGAALSRDGRHLAVASDSLFVIDLESGAHATFSEHTDTISFVAFGADDHRLISADDDNRLVMRRRGPTGYSTAPAVLIE